MIASNKSIERPRIPSRETWRVGSLVYTSAGLLVLFAWLLGGDFAWSMKERTVAPLFQVMLKKYEASDTLTGLLFGSLPLVISMVLSPVVSYKSDRHRGSWGRRIPYLLIPTPVIALAMFGLSVSPAIGGVLHQILGVHSPGNNGSVLIVLGLFWTIFEFSTVVANSVFGALINDVVPDAVLGLFYGAFRFLSLLAGIIFNYCFFGSSEAHYGWIFAGMGALYATGFSMMCLNVKEGEYPPPPPQSSAPSFAGFIVAAKAYFVECFASPYYWWFYIACALSWMAFLPFNLFNYYYARDMEMDLSTYGECTALTYFISLLLSLPLGFLADFLHPLRLSLIVQCIYIVVTFSSGLFVHDAHTFAIALVAHGVLSGTWMTAAASLGQKLLPKEGFAQFASAGGIVGSLGGIVVAPIVGTFLDYTHHEYRNTFFMGSGIAVCALVAGVVVYRKFMALGGPTNYSAP